MLLSPFSLYKFASNLYIYSVMNIKSDRQQAIRRIILDNNVGSQDEILGHLSSQGFEVTQATLSRDFKELGVVKVHTPSDGYIYRLSTGVPPIVPPQNHKDVVASVGLRSIEFSGNMAVVKTSPGFAGAVASVVDSNLSKEIVGTVAGDDTVLLVIREGYSREQVLASMSKFMKGIQTKLI